MNHALLGLSPNIPPGPKEGDLAHDMSHEAAAHKRNHIDKGESASAVTPAVRPQVQESVFCRALDEDFQ